MSKTERQAEVDSITAAIAAAPNIYVTDFAGLDVAKMDPAELMQTRGW